MRMVMLMMVLSQQCVLLMVLVLLNQMRVHSLEVLLHELHLRVHALEVLLLELHLALQGCHRARELLAGGHLRKLGHPRQLDRDGDLLMILSVDQGRRLLLIPRNRRVLLGRILEPGLLGVKHGRDSKLLLRVQLYQLHQGCLDSGIRHRGSHDGPGSRVSVRHASSPLCLRRGGEKHKC
jgi:hypothetical protein